MEQFFDRQEELRELNSLLTRKRGQLLVVTGLRRQGKTSLLLHWAQSTGRPYLYWLARREPAEQTRQSLARALWRWAYHNARIEPPEFRSWEHLFEQMMELLKDHLDPAEKSPLILIFDEFSDGAESDPALPSHIQAWWDHHLQDAPVLLVLTGSHLGMMDKLEAADAPLYGRATAHLQVGPLPYAILADFFPQYSAAQRVALYAVLGGTPAYLRQFDPDQSLTANIRHHLFQRIGMFRSEPGHLIGDLVRETRRYEAILGAIAKGYRTTTEVAAHLHLPPSNTSTYLKRLGQLGLIEKRISALLPPGKRQEASYGAQHFLLFPYLRFYYRFVEPHLEMIEEGLVDTFWQQICDDYQLRAFVGATAWEDLAKQWVQRQAVRGQFPFPPEIIGSHAQPDAQIDVIAINWRRKEIFCAECKWDDEPLHRDVVTKLCAKAALVTPGPDWRTHLGLFYRVGLTAAAHEEAARAGLMSIDLAQLDADLRQLA